MTFDDYTVTFETTYNSEFLAYCLDIMDWNVRSIYSENIHNKRYHVRAIVTLYSKEDVLAIALRYGDDESLSSELDLIEFKDRL